MLNLLLQPLEGALVDAWHADASGDYSGVGRLQDARFLRDIQTTDADGRAAFTTICPGWYRECSPTSTSRCAQKQGRIRPTSSPRSFFDIDLSAAVYTSVAPYSARGVQDTTNVRDGIYAQEMLMVVSETDAGYAAMFDIALCAD